MAFGNTDKTGSGTYYDLLVDAEGRLFIDDARKPHSYVDPAANDSDKTITLGTEYEWEIDSIFVTLVSTATAGNRQICVALIDDSAVTLAEFRALEVQAESLTRYYMFAEGMPAMAAFVDTDYLSFPLPTRLCLLAGYSLRIWDKAAVDPSADDMTIAITYHQKDL